MHSVIIDGNYMLHRVLHMPELVALSTEGGEPTGGVFGVLKTMQKILRTFKTNYCYFVWDGRIKDSRRKSIYPAYKANRIRDKQDTDWQHYMDVFHASRKNLIKVFPMIAVHSVRLGNKEGDDTIWTLSRLLVEDQRDDIVVVSDDWDFAQIVSEKVTLHRAIQGQTICQSNWHDFIDVPMPWYIFYHAMRGDASDNIPGIPGVGVVTLQRAIKGFLSEYPDARADRNTRYRFYEVCGQDKSSRVRRICEYARQVERNILLVDMSLEKFSTEDIQSIREDAFCPLSLDEMETVRFLKSIECASILSNFSMWVYPFRLLN